MENKEEIYIGDLYLAAAFLAYDVPLISIDRSIPRKQKFTFCKTSKLVVFILHGKIPITIQDATLSDIETNFASDTLLFPPKYVDAVRKIKSLIHSNDPNDIHLDKC